MWTNKKLSKKTSLVKIDRICVHQKLEAQPCETQYYRWGSSEDCCSFQKFKLFSGKFSADLSWLIVASVLKQTAFEVRTLKNHLVYEVSEYNPEKVQADIPPEYTYTVNFKVENDVLTPVIVQSVLDNLPEASDGQEGELVSWTDPTELRRSKRRNIQPERYLACDNLPDYEIEVTRLGESKTYKLEKEDTSSDSDDEYNEMPLSVQADNEYQLTGGSKSNSLSYKSNMEWVAAKLRREKKSGKKSVNSDKENGLAIVPGQTSAEKGSVSFDKSILNYKIPEEDSEDIEGMVSRYFYMNQPPSSSKKKTSDLDFMDEESGSKASQKGTRRKYHRTGSHATGLKRDCFYVRQSMYDVRSFKKDSVTAQLCRELIRRSMNNISATLENKPVEPPVFDQWKEFKSKKFSNTEEAKEEEKPPVNNEEEEEISEIDILWREMEVAMASWYLFDDNEV